MRINIKNLLSQRPGMEPELCPQTGVRKGADQRRNLLGLVRGTTSLELSDCVQANLSGRLRRNPDDSLRFIPSTSLRR